MFQDLYRITGESLSGGCHSFGITLDASHSIFRVHFPGTPITPGACQLEILRQLAGRALGREVSVAEVRNIKFLKTINPAADPDITVEETFSGTDEPGTFRCTAVLRAGEAVFTKASFTVKSDQ